MRINFRAIALLNWARDDIQEVEDGFLPQKFRQSGSEGFKRV